MSNPTANFGWVMPTSTDLVTDLPADFAVFGQGVDTTLADLKGGTTGQVLKKNSDTDMDFIWSADSAGMTNPMTTTGDTIYSSSGSTPARLGIGTTGQVLTVSGGVPTWATPSGSSLTYTLINSGNTTVGTAATKTWSSINGYDNYIIYFQNVVCVGAPQSIYCQWNADATSGNHVLTQTMFNWQNSYNAANYKTAYTATDSFYIGQDQSSDPSDIDTISGYVEMLGVGKSTGVKPFKSWGCGGNNSSTGGQRFYLNGARYIGGSAISSFKITTGNNFTSGDVYIYGA